MIEDLPEPDGPTRARNERPSPGWPGRRPTSASRPKNRSASSTSYGHQALPGAPVRRRDAAAGTSERGVLPQDRLLERHHLRGRVDAELARPAPPGAAGWSAAPRPARRRWYCASASSSQRRSRSGAAPHHRRAPGRSTSRCRPLRSSASTPQLLGLEAQLLQASGLAARGRPLREVRRTAAPRHSASACSSRNAARSASPSVQQLAAARPTCASNRRASTSSSGTASAVSVAPRLDGLGPQGLAEPDHARLEVLGRRGRGMVAPDSVDQLVGAHRLSPARRGRRGHVSRGGSAGPLSRASGVLARRGPPCECARVLDRRQTASVPDRYRVSRR